MQGTKAACSPCKHLYGKQNHVTNTTSLMPSTKYAHTAWGVRSCYNSTTTISLMQGTQSVPHSHTAWGVRSCYNYHLFDARHTICTSQSHCMRSKVVLQLPSLWCKAHNLYLTVTYNYHLFDARHTICTSQSHCMRSKVVLQLPSLWCKAHNLYLTVTLHEE